MTISEQIRNNQDTKEMTRRAIQMLEFLGEDVTELKNEFSAIYGEELKKMNDVNLVGFIHQYGANDFSMWNVQLSDEDQKAIEAILDKYRANGISVRGNSEMKLEEVF